MPQFIVCPSDKGLLNTQKLHFDFFASIVQLFSIK